MRLLKALFRFFRSVKLAVALLLVLAGVALLATLAPPGLAPESAERLPPSLWARFVAATGLGEFPNTALFLLPAGLFFLNTAVCTVDRFTRRLRVTAPRRHGPDDGPNHSA